MPPISTPPSRRRARALDGPWGKMSPSARGRMIHKIGDLILEHLDELAQLESLDNGKPFAVARVADVPLSADMFHYMSGWATKLEGKHIPHLPPGGAGGVSVLHPARARSAWWARSFPGISRC